MVGAPVAEVAGDSGGEIGLDVGNSSDDEAVKLIINSEDEALDEPLDEDDMIGAIWADLKASGARSPLPAGMADLSTAAGEEDDESNDGVAAEDHHSVSGLSSSSIAVSMSPPGFEVTPTLLQKHKDALGETLEAVQCRARYQRSARSTAEKVPLTDRKAWGSTDIYICSKFSRLHAALLEDPTGTVRAWQFLDCVEGVSIDVVMHLSFSRMLSGFGSRLREDEQHRYIYPAAAYWDPKCDVSTVPAMEPIS